MKLWKLLLALLLIIAVMYGSTIYFMRIVALEIDSNGGVKSIVERVWNGKEATK